MICSWCGGKTDGTPTCGVCGKPPLLRERYRLEAQLGKRGASTTYRAVDLQSDREVVIKELLLRAVTDAKELQLFEREAELLEQIDHPGVPAFLDHFEWSRGKQVGLYIVQQFLDGESIEAEVTRRRPSEQDVAAIMADVLDVLVALGDRGVVHRDIKPANLVRANDRIALVDFGAGRAVAESIYRAGSTVTGTFGYMAPEQMLAQAVPASDVYGLGATAIRLLSGKEPSALVAEHGSLQWRPAAPNVSAGLAGVIDTMLATNPADRPSDLATLSAKLRSFADGDGAALAEFRNATALAMRSDTALQRPGRGEAAAGIVRFCGVGVAATSLVAAATIAALGPFTAGVMDLFPLVVVLAVITGILGWTAGIRVRRVMRHYAIARHGAILPALVRRRYIDGRDFMVEIEHRIRDDVHRTRHPVTEERFIELAEGDEVTVFCRTEDPAETALADAGVPALLP